MFDKLIDEVPRFSSQGKKKSCVTGKKILKPSAYVYYDFKYLSLDRKSSKGVTTSESHLEVPSQLSNSASTLCPCDTGYWAKWSYGLAQLMAVLKYYAV